MSLSGAGRRRKGATAELATAKYLSDQLGHVVKRNVDRREDEGDLIGVGREVAIEVKSQAKFDLAGWLDQATVAAERAGLRFPVVVVKKRGKTDVGEWYAVCSVETLVAMLREMT